MDSKIYGMSAEPENLPLGKGHREYLLKLLKTYPETALLAYNATARKG